MLDHLDGWVIVTMRLCIVVFVLWMWRRPQKTNFFRPYGVCLIIAGAIGNLLDRFIYGHVIELYPVLTRDMVIRCLYSC